MKKFETLIGSIILIAGAIGVLLMFIIKPPATEEEGTEAATEVPVQVGSIQRATLHGYVYAYGTVEFQKVGKETPPANVLIIAAASGIIARVNCVEGQQVKQGDILFNIDSRLADAAVQKAKSSRDYAQQEFERLKKMKEFGGVSDKDLAKAQQEFESAQAELISATVNRSLMDVAAPISGTVFHIQAKAGESVSTAQTLAELSDIHRLEVTIKVPSKEASLIKLGQKIEINYNQPKDKSDKAPVSGTVTFLESAIDPQTDSVTVRAAIAENSGLQPNQFVNSRIIYDVHENCLAIAQDGVVTDPNGSTYIALVRDDIATRKIVRAMFKESGLQEIAGEGLEEGMKVVIEGAYGLPDQTKILVSNQ
jgi:membrane fusion protein (multidrug efflux system)